MERKKGTPFTGTDDTWGNGTGTDLEAACVDVLFAAQRQWDMVGEWLGRNGLDGKGRGYAARVGVDTVNAYWYDTYTGFGHSSDGRRQLTSMDIVGHEHGHAIFHTAGGEGSGNIETAALSEGTGDIFGTLTEHFANTVNDPPDYTIGEEADILGTGPAQLHVPPVAEPG